MATKSLSLRYGLAAVVVALAIIGTSMYVSYPLTSTGGSGFTSFAVMLTDPPTVPRGTTELNVTYSSIQIHVVSSSGALSWEAAQESGRVNLLSLVNVTKTIASLKLPTGSTVDKLQFALSSATANVSGVVYPVTLLDDQLIVPIRSTKLNGTGTGALIDLRPTLLEINATNSTGGLVKYFVLSPSATAVIQGSVDETQSHVGCMVHLRDKVKDELTKEYIRASHNVTVTSSTLKVDGNVTTLSVTVKNIGSANATFSGLSLMGQFNSTFSWSVKVLGSKGKLGGMVGGMMQGGFMMRYHPEAIPFKVQGDKLVPLFGDIDKVGGWGTTRTVIKPGQSMTLTYSGVIQIRSDGRGKSASVVITPLVGKSYKLWVTSMGPQSFNVIAAAG